MVVLPRELVNRTRGTREDDGRDQQWPDSKQHDLASEGEEEFL
jgi:hypothetical protein